MSDNYQWSQLYTTFKTFSIWFISSLIDAVFLILWVILQWGVNWIIDRFRLSDFDSVIFLIFQILFAISTLIPVIIYIFKDATIMIVLAWRTVKKAVSSNAGISPSISIGIYSGKEGTVNLPTPQTKESKK